MDFGARIGAGEAIFNSHPDDIAVLRARQAIELVPKPTEVNCRAVRGAEILRLLFALRLIPWIIFLGDLTSKLDMPR